MFISEVEHAPCAEVVAVGRVGKGVRRGKVRDGDEDAGAGSANSVNLLHCQHNVLQVLDNIVGVDLCEMTVGKRPWNHVQIMDEVRSQTRTGVHVYGPRAWFLSRSEIEHCREEGSRHRS